jgi:hypothetical protein
VTGLTGEAPPRRWWRWAIVLGALFAVTLFGGASGGDRAAGPMAMANATVCPNVILQASLPGVSPGGAGAGHSLPEDRNVPVDGAAGAGLFLVMALAALALSGGARQPLLTFLAFWWARLSQALRSLPTLGPVPLEALRI